MSPRGGDGSGGGPRPSRLREDWRQAWPGFGLVGLVVGVLVLTAVLQADGPPAPLDDERPGETAAAPLEEAAPVPRRPSEIETPAPPVSAPEPTPAPAPTTAPSAADEFETRSAHDYRRLAGRTGFTLQLMVACDAANARRQLADFLSREALYVLPMDYRGRRCFRICWGVYTSEPAAVAARDLPPGLVARTGRPAPRAIAMVTP